MQKTSLQTSPEHAFLPQHEDGTGTPVSSTPSGPAMDSTPVQDAAQEAGVINSTTVFYPLYSFPGGEEPEETKEMRVAEEGKPCHGHFVEGQRPSADGRDWDMGEAGSIVSLTTDSGAKSPDSLQGGSLKSHGRERTSSEEMMQQLAEASLHNVELSNEGTSSSHSSQFNTGTLTATLLQKEDPKQGPRQ